MEEHQQPQKLPLSLDWDTLHDTPAAELVVKAPDQKPQPYVDLDSLKDYELEDDIRRKKKLLETAGKKLPDGGSKLRAAIELYEEEFRKRKMNPRPQVLVFHVPIQRFCFIFALVLEIFVFLVIYFTCFYN